jgi:hypothetical protein
MSIIDQMASEHIRTLVKKGMSEQEVIGELSAHGVEEHHIRDAFRALKKQMHAVQQRNGFMLAGIGSFVCFVSCVFTMLDVFPAMTGFLLYGLTTIGVLIILAGLIMIFE